MELNQVVQTKLIFVRHAQSEFNLVSLNIRKKYNLPYKWEVLNQHQQIIQAKYDPKLIDSPITKKGFQECAKACQNLKKHRPDIILVSPLNRTLQTCTHVLDHNQGIPVIVQPLLAGGFRSSCDLSSQIQPKMQLYPKFNFDEVKKQGEFWFIKNESSQNQQKYFSVISNQQNINKPFREKLFVILKYMIQQMVYQSDKNMRERARKIKKMLAQKYQGKYKNIAIVFHYNTINFLNAKTFNENHEPEEVNLQVPNCQIIENFLEQILKILNLSDIKLN